MAGVVLLNAEGKPELVEDVAGALRSGSYNVPDSGITISGQHVGSTQEALGIIDYGGEAYSTSGENPVIAAGHEAAYSTPYDKVTSFSQGLGSGITAGILGEDDAHAMQREVNPGYNTAGQVVGMVGGAVLGSSEATLAKGAGAALAAEELGTAANIAQGLKGGIPGLSARAGKIAGESVAKYGKVAQFATEGAVDALSYATAREVAGSLVHDDPFSVEAIAHETLVGGSIGGGLGAAAGLAGMGGKGIRRLLGSEAKAAETGTSSATLEITRAQAEHAYNWSQSMRQQGEIMLEDAVRVGNKEAEKAAQVGLKRLDAIDEVMTGASRKAPKDTFAARLANLDEATAKKMEQAAMEANDSLTAASGHLDPHRINPFTPEGQRAKSLLEGGYEGEAIYAAPDAYRGMDAVRFGDLQDLMGGRRATLTAATERAAKMPGVPVTVEELMTKQLNKPLRIVDAVSGTPVQQLDDLIAASGKAGDVKIPLELLAQAEERQLHKLFGKLSLNDPSGKVKGILSFAQLSDLENQLSGAVVPGEIKRFDTSKLAKSMAHDPEALAAGKRAMSLPYDGGSTSSGAQKADDITDLMKAEPPKTAGGLAGSLMRHRSFRSILGLHFGGITGAIMMNPRAAARVAEAASASVAKATNNRTVRQAAVYTSSFVLKALRGDDGDSVDADVETIHNIKRTPGAVQEPLMDKLVNIRASSTDLAERVVSSIAAGYSALADILPKSNNPEPGGKPHLSSSQRYESKEMINAYHAPVEVMKNLATASVHAVVAVKTCWPELWFKFQQEVLALTAENKRIPDHVARWMPEIPSRFSPAKIQAGMSLLQPTQPPEPPQQSGRSIKPSLAPTINQSMQTPLQE